MCFGQILAKMMHIGMKTIAWPMMSPTVWSKIITAMSGMPHSKKAEQKEELRNLRTQLLTMKEEIARKTTKIETIRDTLKNNKVKVEASNQILLDIEASADDNEIDQAIKNL